MKTTTIFALATATVATVNAHGGMVEPEPRSLTTMGLNIDNSFGYPVKMRADVTNGMGGDCFGFTPAKNLQTLPSGESKIKMRANDGANHIGPCKVHLINPDDENSKLLVGEMDDCMRSLHPGDGQKGDPPIPAEMKIDVPTSDLPCNSDGHCVLKFEWEAVHLSPHEHFNQCADVKIGGSSTSTGDSESTKEEDTPVVEPSSDGNTDAATEKEDTDDAYETPAPGKSSGKYKYTGKDMNKEAMDDWCNANCPNFCPDNLCKGA